jgi:hypothetical protein
MSMHGAGDTSYKQPSCWISPFFSQFCNAAMVVSIPRQISPLIGDTSVETH